MNTTAIAQHLNVADEAIVEIQEWAKVLWVRVKGLGARFVSKKVGAVKEQKQLPESVVRRVAEAEKNRGNESRFKSCLKGLARLADNGRQQLKSLSGPDAQLVRNGIEAIEEFLTINS